MRGSYFQQQATELAKRPASFEFAKHHRTEFCDARRCSDSRLDVKDTLTRKKLGVFAQN